MIEKVKHKGLALALLATAQFMVILDATIVNVALPAIQKSLGFASASDLQWIVTAYALVFGGFLLLGGRLADLFGRRRMLLIGTGIFALASLLGGIAQGPTELIVFRALQGLGGALLSPAALSLVLTIFKEGPERNRALGIWSMVAGGGGAVGLVLGGLLTEYVDWRWTFFINVPIGLAVLLLTSRFVPASLPSAKQKLDITGALTITGSLMAAVYALAKVPEYGWTGGNTILMFGLAIGLLVAFIVNERVVKQPLIDLSIFKRRNVSGGTLLQVLLSASMFSMFFYLSIYLQELLHYSPTQTGIANVPFTIVVILIAGFLSRQVAKINTKPLLVAAPLLAAGGLLYLSRLPLTSNYWVDLLPGIALMASGMAVAFVLVTVTATSGVSHKESGLVSGLLNTSQQIGGALGLAVLSVISTQATNDKVAAAHGNPAALPEALVHGFQQGFRAAVVFAIGASIVALIVLKSGKPSETLDQERENEAEALAAVPGA
jgi:EmrB/QacA subfamily drug resistance transporter